MRGNLSDKPEPFAAKGSDVLLIISAIVDRLADLCDRGRKRRVCNENAWPDAFEDLLF